MDKTKRHLLPIGFALKPALPAFAAAVLLSGLSLQAADPSVSFGTPAPSAITDKQTSTPFAQVALSDADAGEEVTTRISYTAGTGTFPTSGGPTGLSLISAGVYELGQQSPANAQTFLRSLTFTPEENRISIGNSETITFTVTATDETNNTGQATVNLTVTPGNDSPVVSFSGSGPADIDDDETSQPLSGISVSDVDPGDQVTTTIALTGAEGTFPTGSGLTFNSVSRTYTLSARSVGDAQTFLRALVFTPVANVIPLTESGTANFSVTATDTGGLNDDDSESLDINSVNDAPVFSGTVLTSIADNAGTNLFTGLSVSDPDVVRSGGSIVGQSLEVSGTLVAGGEGGDVFGSFQLPGGGSDSEFTLNGTSSAVSTSLQGVGFLPTSDRLPVGSNEVFSIELSVNDGGTPVTRTESITVTSVNNPPALSAVVSPSTINENQTVNPFTVSITDPDPTDTVFSFFIEPVNDTNFQYGVLSPANPAVTNSASLIETFATSVSYQPILNAVATNQVVQFRFRVRDASGGQASITNQITIQGVNETPEITGVSQTVFRTTDDPSEDPVRPFATVAIQDPDAGQNLTVQLSINDNSLGTLSSTNLSGTASVVTAQLRNVTFEPSILPNRVLGESVTATLTITATDSAGASRSNSQTVIVITAVNGAPQILGIPDVAFQPLLVSPDPPVTPFAGLEIRDDSTNPVTLTITLDDMDKGALTNLGGFQDLGAGAYQMIGVDSDVTAALTNLAYDVNEEYVFPPSQPGGTTFALRAVDSVLNSTVRNLSILLQNEPRNLLVTRTDDDVMPGSLRHAVSHAGNNDVITFALEEYPATIRFKEDLGPIEITRNLSLKGPGANLLTLSGDSNGDLQPDTQLFRIRAAVVMEGLTLTRGLGRADDDGAITGGAIYVGLLGNLVMRSCAVTDSMSGQWGGAIDVNRGRLMLENCLIRGNRNDDTRGLGGGAISLYTDESCLFLNTTFSDNHQQATTGYGGGALYIENFSPSTELFITVGHCTFADNSDAAGSGSSLFANAFGTRVQLANTIVADNSGRNLEVGGAARILSSGGNISDDSTRTTLQQGGQPELVTLFSQNSDLTNVVSVLQPLNELGNPTAYYPLAASSPAIGNAVVSPDLPAAVIDQRNVLRDADPDSGAFEANQFRKVVLNEISVHSNPDYLEFYIPRDSTPVDLSGMTLLVNGEPRHLFASGTTLQPGTGILVAETNVPINLDSNVLATVVEPSLGPLDLSERGLIELRPLNPDDRPVISTFYVGVFADPTAPTNLLSYATNSITLAPQFSGFAMLPHSVVEAPPVGGANLDGGVIPVSFGLINSPGRDTGNTPFGSPNGFPTAIADHFFVGEDDVLELDVLFNDLDSDGNDRLFIIDVATETGSSNRTDMAVSDQEADLTILPAGEPVEGTRIQYDPLSSNLLRQLPEGAKQQDYFHYSILDFGNGAIESIASANGGDALLIGSPAHRLQDGDSIRIAGSDVTSYNGDDRVVTRIDDDSFTVPVSFDTDPANLGTWRTMGPRQPTERKETMVTLTVLGANDPPAPMDDDSIVTDEDTVIRILADADLVGESPEFESDSQYDPVPQLALTNLLGNDMDPDMDDSGETLMVIGVTGPPNVITGYSGTPGESPVVVEASGHGLEDGVRILIAGYGGHPSYNGYHNITLINSNAFSIPVFYVDNHGAKGGWVDLNDDNRLSTVSHSGAAVTLEIRADRARTSVLFDPRNSETLNAVPLGLAVLDSFYYAVQDRHGAIGLAEVRVTVDGVNDAPTVNANPASLGSLVAGSSASEITGLLNGSQVNYRIPGGGFANRTSASAVVSGTTVQLDGLPVTDEITPLVIPAAELTGNDSDPDTGDLLGIDSVAATSRLGASLVLSPDRQSISYLPSLSTNLNALAREEIVLDSFEYTVSDGQGGLVDSVLAVLVVGLNDTPQAQRNTLFAMEDQVLEFGATGPDLRSNDIEPDIDGNVPDNQLILAQVQNGATRFPGVRYSINGNVLTYDPTGVASFDALGQAQSTNDVFEYTVSDGSFVFANDDHFKVEADGAGFALQVMANDRNLTGNGTPLTIVAAGTPDQGGTVSVNGDGTGVTYSPEVNFVGDEYFTYTMEDGLGNRDSALVQVRVIVNELNGNLQANPDAFSVARGELAQLNVLANDSILPNAGQSLQITRLVSLPGQGGVLNIAGNGIEYLPAPTPPVGGYPYTEQFTYEISGGGSAVATTQVEVTVVDRTQSLPARNDSYSVQSGSRDNRLNVLVNDSLIPGATTSSLINRIAQEPSDGEVTITPDQMALLYTPPQGFVGTVSLAYEITDGFGGGGSAEVTIHVGSLTTHNDFFSVPYNDPSTTSDDGIRVLDVLANDGVLQNPSDTIRIIGVMPTNTIAGLMSVSDGGAFLEFAPTNGFTGDAVYTYTIAAGTNGTATGQVTVSVREEGIRANPDFFTVLTDSTGNTLAVTLNDASIPDRGLPLSIVSIGTGVNGPNRGGTVTVNPDGTTLSYSPAPGFSGEEAFNYVVTDSRQTDTARVVVRVSSGELRAAPDTFTVFFQTNSNGSARSFNLPLLSNDAVVPNFGQILAITGYSFTGDSTNAPDVRGTLEPGPDNASLIYTPGDTDGPFPFVETFQYEISDGTERRSSAMVMVEVRQRENLQDSVTHDDAFSVLANSTGNPLDVLANDNVLPASAASWTIIDVTPAEQQGAVAIGAGQLIYTPQPGFVGTDSFEYLASDGEGGTGRAKVTVKVGDLPVSSDVFSVLSGTAGNELDVILNDAIRPATADGFQLVNAGPGDRNGSVEVRDNKLFYTPAAGQALLFPYEERFDYVVENDSGGLVTGDVTVQVHQQGSDRSTTNVFVVISGVNDPPVIRGTVAGQRVYQHGTINPFGTVSIEEIDWHGQEPLSVRVQVSPDGQGTLDQTGAFEDRGGGLFVLNGATAGQATAQLRAMQFSPVPGDRVTPGSPELTEFHLTVMDPFAPPVADFNTSVMAVDAALGRVLTPEGTPGAEGAFGTSVAASRKYAVVGAPLAMHEGVQSGAAFLYERDDTDFTQWNMIRKLVPAPLTGGGRFGHSVAVENDTVVVGANSMTVNGTRAGAAVVFKQNEGGDNAWGWSQTLSPADGKIDDRFGSSLVIENSVVVIGAPLQDSSQGIDAGAVYVYAAVGPANATLEFKSKLAPASLLADDRFGASLDMHDDGLLIGAPGSDTAGIDGGAAYLFRPANADWTAWNQIQRLLAGNRAAGDQFGMSVAIESDVLAVAASYRDIQSGFDAGAVYLFEPSSMSPETWSQNQMLQGPVPAPGDRFGESVALDGGHLLVGAPYRNDVGIDAGAAYVYERNPDWQLMDVFQPATGSELGGFGNAVDAEQGTALVGASMDDTNGDGAGSAYFFQLRYNNAPQLSRPIGNQIAIQNRAYQLAVPAGTFTDPDPGDALALSLQSNPAMSWVQFDPATRVISGTPVEPGVVELNLIASDLDGATATNQFQIVVWSISDAPPATAVPAIVPNLEFGSDIMTGQYLLSYIRIAGDTTRQYSLQCSGDLEIWTAADSRIVSETIEPLDNGSERVRLFLPDQPGDSGRYYRIVVYSAE